MRVLVVYAHPEPRSFNGAMKDLAVGVLERAGHEVRVSDLYAKRFDPVPHPDNFIERNNTELFVLGQEQLHAQQRGTVSPDVREEQEVVSWAELIIFQFPLWWWSVPAILKGWFDRVMTNGFAYGDGTDLVGRKALVTVTAETVDLRYSRTHAPECPNKLHNVLEGMLAFVGIEVLNPFVVLRVHVLNRGERECRLCEYEAVLSNLDRRECIASPPRELD